MSKRKRTRKIDPVDEQKLQLLDQLKELVRRMGVEVREERLVREVGYSVRSGPCVVNGSRVVLLDSGAVLSDRIEVLLEVLSAQDLDDVYIEPELRRLITGPVTREDVPEHTSPA